MLERSAPSEVSEVIAAHMPVYSVTSLEKLGEGLENIAYEVNHELIVRFSKESDPQQRAMQLARETSVLAVVAAVSPLAVPVPTFTVPELGCLAYSKIPGMPLWDLRQERRLAQAVAIAATLGDVLSALHAVPIARVVELVETDSQPLLGWRQDAAEIYARSAAEVPAVLRPAIETFLAARPPDADHKLVFSHNDLGCEHVLVEPHTLAVTGIIDWSDAALVDAAYDFGLIYRDLGAQALDAALSRYRPDQTNVPRLRERAIFYARCSVFEDLAYGLELNRAGYVEHSIAAMRWLFPAQA